jgi:hypothetical protein
MVNRLSVRSLAWKVVAKFFFEFFFDEDDWARKDGISGPKSS